MKKFLLALAITVVAILVIGSCSNTASADNQPAPVAMTPCVQPCGNLVTLPQLEEKPKHHKKHRPVKQHRTVSIPTSLPNTGA